MTTRDDIPRLLREAAASLKHDLAGAVTKLEAAYAAALGGGIDDDVAVVAEELARAWGRRKSAAKALYYAAKATKLSPKQRTSWTTLAKTCELLAARIRDEKKQGRARALYRTAGKAFEKAASLTKDAEDKRWLQELARDAAKQGKAPST